ncbi:MAG: molybdopterin-dependent oxidoreductase, partial [Coriobacteriaceae bacterium]|nr:molybdopterin-dependent oxidoreductase [Coriobacteriaceae bacterium]
MVGCINQPENNQPEESGLGGTTSTAGEWIPTCCNMCFNACAILVNVVDGVVVDVKGDSRSPIGGGRICAKGAAGIMLLYDPDRVKQPLIRTNPNKGLNEDPQWEEVSYDEAFDILLEKMAGIRDSGGKIARHQLITALPTSYIFRALLNPLGATEGSQPDICGAGIHTAYDIFTSTGNGMPDYRYCDYLLQFGTQAGTATRHGLNMTAALFAQRRADGMKLVSVDPHMSASGEKADLWVPIRPGTDAAFALSMSHVLVNELELIDYDYLKNRTNGPALVDVATNRIVRAADSDKALYMDSDNVVKPYDEAADPFLEGTFEYEGKTVTTGFSLYKEHLKKYTPEYQETITTVPADTVRKVAKEFGEAARIGETIDIEGVSMPYRPVCVDLFSGISRHKHAFLTQWSLMQLNVLVGSCNSVGGFIGYAPACNGWTDDSDFIQWRPEIWPDDGFTDHVLMFLGPKESASYYQVIKEGDFTPQSNGMVELQPLGLGLDAHFYMISQAHPEIYHTEPARMLINLASSPLTFWGNHDEQAEVLKAYEYVVNVDIYLNSSTYFADLVIPEASYLERLDPLPHSFCGHRTIGGMGVPWSVNLRQPVIEPLGGAMGGLAMCAEIADRAGINGPFIGTLNYMFHVKEENSIPLDQKLDPEAFCDSVYRSVVDDEHDLEWFKQNGPYTHPRKVDEVYIWAGDAPGKVPP